MLKSVQIKIVLIFMIIGILMLGLQGVLFSEQLQEISTEIVKNSELEEMLVMQVKRTQFLTISLIIVFTIISILVGIFVAKVIKDIHHLNLTEKEKNEGAKLLWVEPKEALKLITECYDKLLSSNYDDVYDTRFVVLRDRKILEYYLNN